MKGAYYNEFDRFAAQWLRNLIAAGVIAPGDVDERSIVDVRPDDLRGYRQHHFFAGIGGWSVALRMAGWADDEPVWTGSCPCQPFSVAGRQKGVEDERHLWPVWRELIRAEQPASVFGEQVASPAGRAWLSSVRSEMEAMGYEVGGADLCAAGVTAPEIRQRLWFVADASGARVRDQGRAEDARPAGRTESQGLQRQRVWNDLGDDGHGPTRGVEHADSQGPQGQPEVSQPSSGQLPAGPSGSPGGARPVDGFWGDCDWLHCRDGLWRPVEPDTFPLAHGVPSRVGRIRAYGNAIVPQVAAEFISAYREIRMSATTSTHSVVQRSE